MGKKLVNADIEPACEYCVHGHMPSGSEYVLCKREGLMPPDSHCRKFKYDPLRRKPKKAPVLPEYSEDDFKI